MPAFSACASPWALGREPQLPSWLQLNTDVENIGFWRRGQGESLIFFFFFLMSQKKILDIEILDMWYVRIFFLFLPSPSPLYGFTHVRAGDVFLNWQAFFVASGGKQWKGDEASRAAKMLKEEENLCELSSSFPSYEFDVGCCSRSEPLIHSARVHQ